MEGNRKTARCLACGGEAEPVKNFCGWACHVEHAKRHGGKVHTPNGLPIACIKHDGTMLEHEHGDHADYAFPVAIEWTGARLPDAADWEYMPEKCALIYTDGVVALTMHEYDYDLWWLKTGECLGGYHKEQADGSTDGWNLTKESIDSIIKHHGNRSR